MRSNDKTWGRYETEIELACKESPRGHFMGRPQAAGPGCSYHFVSHQVAEAQSELATRSF